MTTMEVLQRTAAVKTIAAMQSTEAKSQALLAMADALVANTESILEANAADVEAARQYIGEVMLDRLCLSAQRIEAMADGIRQVAQLPDPVGRVTDTVVRPNGITIEKMSVPFGVLAIIYESRPNVTSDAAALAIMSGNCCVLRCGKEAWQSAKAIVDALRAGLASVGLPQDMIGLVEDRTRQGAKELMTAVGYVDLLIPRGGPGLISACVQEATVPCIQTGTGICHIYVHGEADVEMAVKIIENAKTSRPSVCNAAECCLVDRSIAPAFLPALKERLVEGRIAKGLKPVELRGDADVLAIIPATASVAEDYDTEFLDYIMAVKVVDGPAEAIQHIGLHSTHHSDAIITENIGVAEQFVMAVDSAAVYVNASTRFTDGGEFGLGCEMGISTQKMHARGPMGLMELTTYKYVVRGRGQVR
ncbi:MAG: glutamate-5-semialdehyde dehydrogenase [Clostridia bacterium]|nr:glutamate-5-semialdehyde dehydrogenase [Clostridia bacterium]